jgi:hypothetical protein
LRHRRKIGGFGHAGNFGVDGFVLIGGRGFRIQDTSVFEPRTLIPHRRVMMNKVIAMFLFFALIAALRCSAPTENGRDFEPNPSITGNNTVFKPNDTLKVTITNNTAKNLFLNGCPDWNIYEVKQGVKQNTAIAFEYCPGLGGLSNENWQALNSGKYYEFAIKLDSCLQCGVPLNFETKQYPVGSYIFETKIFRSKSPNDLLLIAGLAFQIN